MGTRQIDMVCRWERTKLAQRRQCFLGRHVLVSQSGSGWMVARRPRWQHKLSSPNEDRLQQGIPKVASQRWHRQLNDLEKASSRLTGRGFFMDKRKTSNTSHFLQFSGSLTKRLLFYTTNHHFDRVALAECYEAG